MSDNYTSGQKPVSKIVAASFLSRLSAIFGYRVPEKAKTDFGKKYGMEFVNVSLDNPLYRIKQAAIGSVFKSQNLSTQLQKYFDAYARETMVSYDSIAERQARLNELLFAYYNCEFVNRAVKLTADEATQLDQQDRIVSVESSNVAFISRTYELLSKWGVTQDRIHAACMDIELYGEAFWSNKVTLNGVEKIIPIGPAIVQERLEFSAMKTAEFLAQRDGWAQANKSRQQKIEGLIKQYQDNKNLEYSESITDMFETKLLGFEMHDGVIVPPWAITHFRYDADNSEFFPYGRPPLLGCLAPFNQVASTMALQGLSRSMSLPVTIYKVKVSDGTAPADAFETVNTVREEYDNVGATPKGNGVETYTVNTKIWVPEGLMDVEVKNSESQIDFTGDIELYMDRVATASGIPKGYLDQEFGGFGNSGISLVEQYKPFARHVYTVQSVFLQGLGQLIRLHYAITGEFDYNTPFLLTMRFPAQEMGEEQRASRTASLELTSSIMELLQTALGLGEDEPLPEDVVKDIVSKYTFLDPTEVERWVRISTVKKLATNASEDEEDEESGMDFDMGDEEDVGAEEMPEGVTVKKPRLRETLRERELKEKRLREISKRYKENRHGLHVQFLEEHGLVETFGKGRHDLVVKKFDEETVRKLGIDAFKQRLKGRQKLNETTVEDMMEKASNDLDDLATEFLDYYEPRIV